MRRIKVTESSGNVFFDLGFPRGEAVCLLVRADLMITIEEIIKSRRFSNCKAANLFGVSQPRISDLIRGKIYLFSIDGLVAMLGHAGMSVTFHVKSAA